MITIFAHQTTDLDQADGAAQNFAGGVGTVHATFHGTGGRELVTVLARPTGSVGDFKEVAAVFCHSRVDTNIELKGPHQIKGRLTGATPATDVTLEIGN